MMGRSTGLTPVRRLSRSRMLTGYIMISILILRSAPPRHHLLYERSALLVSATEEKKVLPRGLAPRTSAFARRHAGLLHLGSERNLAAAGIAPASPHLQRGANLFLAKQPLVPSRGNAPRS